MRVHYRSDNKPGKNCTLAELCREFETAKFTRQGGYDEVTMREELATRGWYEASHMFGRFLVLDLAKFKMHEFCRACGASIPPREGEGTCPKCAS